jgi:hypothetical protein
VIAFLKSHSAACNEDYLRLDVTIRVPSIGLLAVPNTVSRSLLDEPQEAVSDLRGWKTTCYALTCSLAMPCTLVILTMFSQSVAGAVVPADVVPVVDTKQFTWVRSPRQSSMPHSTQICSFDYSSIAMASLQQTG